jgi:HEAT repeat protein/TolA-binding protein
MKLTLMKLLMVGAVVPLVVAAQVPPAPPTPPRGAAPRSEPQPTPRPPKLSEMPLPPLVYSPKFELEYHMELLKPELDEIRMKAELMRPDFEFQMELMKPALEDIRLKADEMRIHAMEFAQIDREQLKAQAEHMKEFAKLDVEHLKFQAEEMSRKAMWDMPLKMDFDIKMDAFHFDDSRQDKLLNSRPPAPWANEDPADSLYRVAREALNRGEYRRAAQLFNEVTKKFPRSQYAQDCAYWEAFSRYRVGTNDELKQALRVLESINIDALMRVGRDNGVDVPGLRARVQAALAARGDADAAKQLERDAAQNSGCDREEVSVRAEALSALGQMDLATAMPVVKKVLQRRDECTVELRRRALFLIGRNPNSESVPIMLDVAKNDTDPNIRGEAMSWLSRVAGDQAVPLLEELLRTSNDERTQRSAISALSSIDTDRARRAVRTIIERNDAPERVRYDAIIGLSREKDGRVVSAEEQGYVRSLYGKLESARLREAVLTSVSRIATPENEKFLLDIARNQNESSALRATALQRLGRMPTVGLNDIARLYDVADARSLREQVLSALYQRKEPEAVDKMMEIARKDTDPQIRRYAISLLLKRNDPRVAKLLQEMIDR